MKVLRLIVLYFFLVLPISCSKSEPPIPEPDVIENSEPETEPVEPMPKVYFTLNVDETQNTEIVDNWIIIHDNNGKLMDFKSYESGEKLNFEALESDITDEITITFFSTLSRTGKKNSFLTSYGGISQGVTWTLASESIAAPSESGLGIFNAKIDNIEGVSNSLVYGLSNIMGTQTITSSYSLNDPAKVTFEAALNENNDYLIYVINDSMEPKYVFLSNTQVGDNFTFNYEDLDSFDSYLNINLPPNNSFTYSINGYENDIPFNYTGYELSAIISPELKNPNSVTSLKFGYLTQFSKYKTKLSVAQENWSYNFTAYGEKPEEIIVPENLSLEIQNESVFDFDYVINFNFVKQSNSWSNRFIEFDPDKPLTYWLIHSGSDFPNIENLPQELLDTYPTIDLENLKPNSSKFEINSAKDYQSFIEEKFILPGIYYNDEETIYFSTF